MKNKAPHPFSFREARAAGGFASDHSVTDDVTGVNDATRDSLKKVIVAPGDLVIAKSYYYFYENDEPTSKSFVLYRASPMLVVYVKERPTLKQNLGDLICVCFVTSSPAQPLGWFYAYSCYFDDHFSILARTP